MNAVRGIAVAAALLLLPFTAQAQISATQKDLLNNHFGSVAKKVQLGTLIDNAEAVNLTDLPSAVVAEATGTLTQANIIAMNGTPVTLLAAPGAGKVLVVDEVEIFHDYATAAYTGGGDVTIEYQTSGVDLIVFDVALVTAAVDANYVWKTGGVAAAYATSASTSSASDLSTSANKAVTITNATAVFAGGNASNIIKWRIRYHVVTLIT